MWNNLLVIHRQSDGLPLDIEIPKGFLEWNTCLRSVYIGEWPDSKLHSVLSHGWEIYSGFHAYEFLLQVVTGSQSKMFGESEIQSQFRDLFQFKNLSDPNIDRKFFIQLRDQILEHSKMIRSEFFSGHGRQTYGGIADSLLPSEQPVTIFGTGNLTDNILIHCLKKNRPVKVVGRDSDKLGYYKQKFPIEISFWEDYVFQNENLVIAISNSGQDFFQSILNSPSSIKSEKSSYKFMILDFRSEHSLINPPNTVNYIPFAQILGRIQATEQNLDKLKPKLYSRIRELTLRRAEMEVQFPNGWEDLICLGY